MSVSSGDLPTIGKEFWDIIQNGTDHLKPHLVAIYGTNEQLAGLSFLEAGNGIEGAKAVIGLVRDGIHYSLLAYANDIIMNAKSVSQCKPDVPILLNSDPLNSLIVLANNIKYIDRALKNVPEAVNFIRSERSGLKGIIAPVCERLVLVFTGKRSARQRSGFYLPNDLFDGLANYQNLL
jgi:hypothetical protein